MNLTNQTSKTFDRFILTTLALVLITRLLLARFGIHPGDFGSWVAWGEFLVKYGPANFFNGIWSDRLPGGALYLVWFLATIKHLYPFLPNEFIYKLPANLADVAVGWLLYKYYRQKRGAINGLLPCLLYVLNPYTWHVSALWGQMDAVQALVLVLVILSVLRQQYLLAGIMFTFIFLFKPHSIALAPLLIVTAWRQRLNIKDFWHKLSILTGAGLISMWFFSLPFAINTINKNSLWSIFSRPIILVWDRFVNALDIYPYATIHALNWWMIFGKNWSPDSQSFWSLSYHTWGLIMFSVFCLVVLGLVLAKPNQLTDQIIFLAAAALSLAAFSFLTRAHDKHFYPFFALFAFTLLGKNQRWRIGLYVVMMLVGLNNTVFSYSAQYGGGVTWSPDWLRLVSFIPPMVSILLLAQLAAEAGITSSKLRSLFRSYGFNTSH